MLLVDALATAVSAIQKVGGRLIVVGAVDEAAEDFHLHHGFIRSPSPREPG